MDKKEDDTPLIYLWLYKKMVERFGSENTIALAKDFLEILRRTTYQIPRKYDYFILKEMCNYKLLEKINSQKYKLLGSKSERRLRKLNDYFLW
jgi:hypothetical protein